MTTPAAAAASRASRIASAPPLPADVETEVAAAFALYAGGAGALEIAPPQLAPLLRALGQVPTAAEVADLLEACDLDGNHSLSLDEVRALLAYKFAESAADHHDARPAFDGLAGADGVVTRDDLARVLASAGGAFTDADIDAMFAAAGVERGSGAAVDFAGFCAVLDATAARGAEAEPPPAAGGGSKRKGAAAAAAASPAESPAAARR